LKFKITAEGEKKEWVSVPSRFLAEEEEEG
jgi:hypothetical protein